MTEKRFTFADGFKIVAIRENGEIMNSTRVCDKLNELYEENKELQERNNRQCKQLDDLYRLIEKKDWRALSNIIDDFKKAEEQLQSEWQTYEDKND